MNSLYSDHVLSSSWMEKKIKSMKKKVLTKFAEDTFDKSARRYSTNQGFPCDTSDKELAFQCRRRKRHRFDPHVGKILWRREWQPTPVFMPGESYGQRSLESCSSWGLSKELDATEATACTAQIISIFFFFLLSTHESQTLCFFPSRLSTTVSPFTDPTSHQLPCTPPWPCPTQTHPFLAMYCKYLSNLQIAF